ncbi:MAG: hypothetical protein SFU86_03395 [Pirellulaceae bacterium]|nr:hypothetical protein [Pirellulaceae bacterium]
MSALVVGGSSGVLHGNETAPAEFLAARGLSLLADKYWLLTREIELRDRLARLPKRRERLIGTEKDLEAAIDQNARLWRDNQPAMLALKQSLGRLSPSDPQRGAIERQIAALEGIAVEPARLGAVAEIRGRVAQWSSERYAMLADVAWIRQTAVIMNEEYRALADDPDVRRALRQAGDGQKLGPQRNYQPELSRLADHERLVATSWTPIFLQSGQTRVTALVDEVAAVTFSWSDSLPAEIVLTASAAEAAGIVPAENAPRETITLPSGRRLACRKALVAYFQLGPCQLHGVMACVLPPEAEDAGNWLGRSALAEYQVRLVPEKLRMWIEP